MMKHHTQGCLNEVVIFIKGTWIFSLQILLSVFEIQMYYVPVSSEAAWFTLQTVHEACVLLARGGSVGS